MSEPPDFVTARVAAYSTAASVGVLVLNAVLGATTGSTLIFEVLGPLYRLLLIPAVVMIAAPNWARAGAWFWILGDSAINIATLNGMEDDLAFQLRMGVHLGFALWAITLAVVNRGAVRWTALAAGLVTGVYSFIAPWVSEAVLAASALLLLVFIVATARHLTMVSRSGISA